MTIAEMLAAARAHRQAGRFAAARALSAEILQREADNVDALYLAAIAAQADGDLPAAIDLMARALALKPGFAAGYGHFGVMLGNNGQLAAAIDALQTALSLAPDDLESRRHLLNCLLYVPDLPASVRFAAHREFAARHRPPFEHRLPPPANDRDPGRRLRIGILSSDLRSHPVGQMLLSIFRHRDKAAIELYCYAELQQPDIRTDAIRALCDGWRPTLGLDDRAVAELIRGDGIDLLAISGGHFDRNRPLIACYRPAPVQISMFDGATSGLDDIDVLVTDPVLSPADGATERFTERLAKLPHLFHFPRFGDTPPIKPLPASTNGFVTFGSFNNPIKISHRTVTLWARTLLAVPQSRLILKYRKRFSDPLLCVRLRTAFGALGVDPARIQFIAIDDAEDAHLERHGAVDIALDTVPFNGCTTTFEALWMGVPVIALAGDTMMSRMSASILTAAGLPDLIARAPDAFVTMATKLAADLDRLVGLRAGLRDQVARSSLCDGPAYARSLEALWRALWHDWCAA